MLPFLELFRAVSFNDDGDDDYGDVWSHFFLNGTTVFVGGNNQNQNILNHLWLPISFYPSNRISCKASYIPLLLSSFLSIPIPQMVVWNTLASSLKYYNILLTGPSAFTPFPSLLPETWTPELTCASLDGQKGRKDYYKMLGSTIRRISGEFSNSSCHKARHHREGRWRWL